MAFKKHHIFIMDNDTSCDDCSNKDMCRKVKLWTTRRDCLDSNEKMTIEQRTNCLNEPSPEHNACVCIGKGWRGSPQSGNDLKIFCEHMKNGSILSRTMPSLGFGVRTALIMPKSNKECRVQGSEFTKRLNTVCGLNF